jgi:murein DD-endopeptidase MepM/ murein hydrolase activator NlpD
MTQTANPPNAAQQLLVSVDESAVVAAGETSPRGQGSLREVADTREGRLERNLTSAALRLRDLRSRLEQYELEAETTGSVTLADEKDTPATTSSLTSSVLVDSQVEILQRWDGVVLSVGDETFRARLFDQRSGKPRVEADVYLSDVAEQDRSLLKPNATFYWHMGYRDPHGDRERVSKIRFQRLPPKSQADIRRAELRVAERRKLFGWQ